MTGETMLELLEPLIGKVGSISVVVSETGPIGLARGKSKELKSVELRSDGLVRLEREDGWAVIDPSGVVAVVWNSDTDTSPGQFL